MTRVVAIIQARMGSTRLPGKVLMDLGGKPVLQWVVEAAKAVSLRFTYRKPFSEIAVATSTKAADAPIVDWCLRNGIKCVRGSESDVLRRYLQAARSARADVIVRLTADCPLLEPNIIEQVIRMRASENGDFAHSDYASNVDPPTFPDGQDCEAFTMAALKFAHQHARRLSDREHVTTFMRRDKRFIRANLTNPAGDQSHIKLSIDTIEDLERVRAHIRKVA